MPDAALQATQLTIGRSLITAESIAYELRDRLIRRLADSGNVLRSQGELLELAHEVLPEFEPLLGRNIMANVTHLSPRPIRNLAWQGKLANQQVKRGCWGLSSRIRKMTRSGSLTLDIAQKKSDNY